MDVAWDEDNFEPKLPTTLTSSNKWEGEDEEEAVKDSWEDEEEEKKDEEKKDVTPPPPKPKKKIHDKIAEKERLEREKAERLAEKEEEMTPEEKLAEKLQRQKMQEESDLRLAMETFGISESAGGKLDSFQPTNKEEFTEFGDLLSKKINLYKAKEEFPAFVDDLIKNIIVQMPSADMKRIKMTVDNLYIEKQKAEKNEKAKKPNKGKGKAKLKVEGDNAHLNQYDSYGNFQDDYDDFM